MHKIFIVGFPRSIDEVTLLELLSLHGMVGLLTIVRDQETKESKGYAFAQMLDRQSAERTIAALHGFRMGDRTLHVRWADTPGRSDSAAPGRQTPRLQQPRTPGLAERPKRQRKRL
jgi:RNA recognition motif-containing protein